MQPLASFVAPVAPPKTPVIVVRRARLAVIRVAIAGWLQRAE